MDHVLMLLFFLPCFRNEFYTDICVKAVILDVNPFIIL